MHLPVLGSDPYSRSQRRGVADEPSVGLVVGGTGLSCNLAFQTILGTQSHSCSAVDHTLHEIRHEIRCVVAHCLTLEVVEFSEQVAAVVLDPCHEYRCDEDSFGREGIVCRHHIVYWDVCRSDA